MSNTKAGASLSSKHSLNLLMCCNKPLSFRAGRDQFHLAQSFWGSGELRPKKGEGACPRSYIKLVSEARLEPDFQRSAFPTSLSAGHFQRSPTHYSANLSSCCPARSIYIQTISPLRMHLHSGWLLPRKNGKQKWNSLLARFLYLLVLYSNSSKR